MNFRIEVTDTALFLQRQVKNALSLQETLYNNAGGTTKDFLSVIFSLIYLCFLACWVFTCVKNHAYVHRIHILMGALIVTVTLDLIYGPADTQCAKMISTCDGWYVVFYTFKFMRVVLFNTVMVLIAAGWSFLRPLLQVKEMTILMMVILFNVASALIRDTNPFHIDKATWGGWCFVVDCICLLSFLIPISGTTTWLDKVCKVDVKAAKTFAKIREYTWLDDAPKLASVYFHMWKFFVSCAKTPGRVYTDDAPYVVEEIFSLLFCIAMFYMFRPAVENEYYCFLDVQDEVEVTQWAKGKTSKTDPVPRQKHRNRRGK